MDGAISAGDNKAPLGGPGDIELGSKQSPLNTTSDPFLVEFQEPTDRENPRDWPDKQKWAVTNVLSITGFNRIMVSTIMAPTLTHVAADLNMTPTESAMSLSIYLLATAFGPLVAGPMSELYGRNVILNGSGIWFLAFNLACGFANTKEVLIASRFLAGFGASSIYALAGGVLGDVWTKEQRGKSLGIYLLIPLLGAAAGMCPVDHALPSGGRLMTDDLTRTYHWWLHGEQDYLEMDLLVYIHIPGRHGCLLHNHLPGDVCPGHPAPPR